MKKSIKKIKTLDRKEYLFAFICISIILFLGSLCRPYDTLTDITVFVFGVSFFSFPMQFSRVNNMGFNPFFALIVDIFITGFLIGEYYGFAIALFSVFNLVLIMYPSSPRGDIFEEVLQPEPAEESSPAEPIEEPLDFTYRPQEEFTFLAEDDPKTSYTTNNYITNNYFPREKRFIPKICPQCGGKLEMNSNRDEASCPYCGAEFLYE